MGRVVVVRAHPSNQSFNRALFDATCEGVESAGHEVVEHDLYDDRFDAAMTPEQRRDYEQGVASAPSLVARYASDVQTADGLAFVFPIWWWSPPAAMKGWFEQVLCPGVAVNLDRRFGPPRPMLTNIRNVLAVSTNGSPRWAAAVMPDAGSHLVNRDLRAACGLRTRMSWQRFHSVDGSTDAERRQFIDDVRAAATIRFAR